MIIYSRFILSLSLLSKYERSGQNSTSVSDRPYFNAEFSQKPVSVAVSINKQKCDTPDLGENIPAPNKRDTTKIKTDTLSGHRLTEKGENS